MTKPHARSRQLEITLEAIQRAFPRIYLACHTRHQRKRSTAHRLSPRDSSILSHLDKNHSVTPRVLSEHLGIAPSTLSEALKRLAALGFVTQPPGDAGARRRSSVLLSADGARAMQDTSVLETARLGHVLAGIPTSDLNAIADAIQKLGEVCRDYSLKARNRRESPE